MRRALANFGIVAACLFATGCTERDKVGGGFVLITPPTLGPDHHPGTALHRDDKLVWDNVYVGYFHPHPPGRFFRDGMFVFVGPLPGNGDWKPGSQLFAVRGGDLPVLLSDRLAARPGAGDAHPGTRREIEIRRVTPDEQGVEVEVEYWANAQTEILETNHLAWVEIKGLLDEAATAGRSVHHQLGEYRTLPSR